jgi:hypothetical protein
MTNAPEPFVHYCHCGKWGAFGYGVSLRQGKLGQWYCAEHRPDAKHTRSAPPPADCARTPPSGNCHSNSFVDWLRENPAPHLEDLVRQHGSFREIPPAAWLQWEERMSDWRARYRDRHLETPLTRTAAGE